VTRIGKRRQRTFVIGADMSIKLMSAIFETEFPDYLSCGEDKTKASTAKLVLLAIADHANDEGESAYPGLARLGKKTGLSKTGIIDTLKILKFNGLIVVDEEPSKLGTNNYTIITSAYPCLQKSFEVGSQATLLVNPLDQGGQPTLPVVVNPLDMNHSLITSKTSSEKSKNEKTVKKGNMMDGILFYAGQSVEQGIDQVENTLVGLERGLKRNIPRHGVWQDLAKWMNKRPNEPYKKWVSWYMKDNFNAKNAWRLTPEQIRNSWPGAFVEEPINSKIHAL